jgi:hypothetical protein
VLMKEIIVLPVVYGPEQVDLHGLEVAIILMGVGIVVEEVVSVDDCEGNVKLYHWFALAYRRRHGG